jgi:rhodanese-related sulfurtransferase
MRNLAFRLVPLAFALLAFAPAGHAAEPFKMLSVDEVQGLLGKPGVHVFDVNTPERFEQGRLPGATFVTNETVAEQLPPNREATLIFYCMNPK